MMKYYSRTEDNFGNSLLRKYFKEICNYLKKKILSTNPHFQKIVYTKD